MEENKVEQNEEPKGELLDLVFQLESEKQALVEEARKKIGALRKELEEKESQNVSLSRKVEQLEQSLKQSVMLCGSDAPKSRQEQDDLLLKAKTLLFEKTKVNKQQEQQISTLKTQVDAIKEVLEVTKEMLKLKSAENDHMQARLEQSQNWIKAERDKNAILEKKLEISRSVYDKLRAEYDLQSKIFKELKETYEQKNSILSAALVKAKEN